MIAVILAAGLASRLRPITDTRPKCLLQVGERCLLQRTIDAIRLCGIEELVLVTGYREDMIQEFVNQTYGNGNNADGKSLKVHFISNPRYNETNNIYSLYLSGPVVRGRDFVLLDSDILFDPEVLRRVVEAPSANALALNRHELGDEEIKVIADQDGRVMEISKVCSIEKAEGESVGIEKMSATYSEALFETLDQMIGVEGQDNVFYEKAFERLIDKGQTFTYVDTTDAFSIELDTVEDFRMAKELIPAELY